jgi:hypothetical protein
VFLIIVSGLAVVVVGGLLFAVHNQSPRKAAKSRKTLKVGLTVALVGASFALLGSALSQTSARQRVLNPIADMERSPMVAAIKAHHADAYEGILLPARMARTLDEQQAILDRLDPTFEQFIARQLRLVDTETASRYLDMMNRTGVVLEAGDPANCRAWYVGGATFDRVAVFGEKAVAEREKVLGDVVVQTATRPARTASPSAIDLVNQRINDLAAGDLPPEQLARLDGFFDTGKAPSDAAGAAALCRYLSRRLSFATRLSPSDKQVFVQGFGVF